MFSQSSLPLIDEDKSFIPQQKSNEFQFRNRDEFDKMHKKVMILIANKAQNEYAQKVKDHEERAKNLNYNFRTTSSQRPLN